LRPRLRAAKGETIETADGWEALEAWRYHDDHLRTWQVGQRESALRSRREIYRLFAVGLARRYGTLVLEDFDLRPMARRPKRTDAPRENETARSNRHRVAVSKLRDALTQAFGGAVEIDPAGTTHLCHRCGTHNDFDAAEHLIHRCVNCETTWDQDENAARNLLARYLRERSGDAQTPGGARKDGKPSDSKPVHRSKHARKAAAKAARIEALKAAREGVDNAAE
jgi:transposase